MLNKKHIAPIIAIASVTSLLPASYADADIGSVSTAQRLLVQLGYDPGVVDGLSGPSTRRAISAFYEDRSDQYDGVLDFDDIKRLEDAVVESGLVLYRPLSSYELQTQFTVEPEGAFVNMYDFRNNQFTGPGRILFGWEEARADFNGDGINDLLVIGVSARNLPVSEGGDCTADVELAPWIRNTKAYCAPQLRDKPILFFGTEDGGFSEPRFQNIIHAPTEYPERQGMGYPTSIRVADYNQDGVPDFFIAETGGYTPITEIVGDWPSIYLSDGNGNWVWRTDTHLSGQRNLWGHAAAQGDIDNDGDIDIIVSQIQRGLGAICLINDGSGSFTTKRCFDRTMTTPLTIQLADFDNDGDLDAFFGTSSHPEDGWGQSGSRTRFYINNGLGNFAEQAVVANDGCWTLGPHGAVGDFDRDGDYDVVESLTRELYVLGAVRILENTGAFQVTSHLHQLVETTDMVSDLLAPLWSFNDQTCETFLNGEKVTFEDNDLSAVPRQFYQSDADGDGDLDIIIVRPDQDLDGWSHRTRSTRRLVHGAWIENNGGPIATWRLRTSEQGRISHSRIVISN